jgi:hypothetical protein
MRRSRLVFRVVTKSTFTIYPPSRKSRRSERTFFLPCPACRETQYVSFLIFLFTECRTMRRLPAGPASGFFAFQACLIGLSSLLSPCVGVHASQVLDSVNFSSGYVDANLVGQNNWEQTGTSATNPIQVSSGTVVVNTSGQDAYRPLTSGSTALVTGEHLLTRIDFRISSAQAAGDYFFHLSDPVGTTSVFVQRFYARSADGGFVLGLSASSTNLSNPASYGTEVLSLNTPYTAVVKWDFIDGPNNDLMSLYVNPIDPHSPSGTPYTSNANWPSLEPANISAINLRQGTASNAPVALVDSITVSLVPEPGTWLLAATGLFACLVASLRRRHSWSNG